MKSLMQKGLFGRSAGMRVSGLVAEASDGCGRLRVRLTVGVDLRRTFACVLDAGGPLELAVQVVEAAVLEVDDDEVAELRQVVRRRGVRASRYVADGEEHRCKTESRHRPPNRFH